MISIQETCTILAALDLFTQVRVCDICPDGTRIDEMPYFKVERPLDPDQIDELRARLGASVGIALMSPDSELAADVAESLRYCTECGSRLRGEPPLDAAGNPSPRMCAYCRKMRGLAGATEVQP